MNKTNRIRTFFIVGTGVLIGGITWWNHTPENVKAPETTKVSETEKEDEEKTVSASKEEKSYEYVILNRDGYLCVYERDLKTIYFQTDIAYVDLSKDLQKKIDDGYLLKDLDELYQFLENYSS